jgi:hypothetical protein
MTENDEGAVRDFPDKLRNFLLGEMERLGVKGDIDGAGCDSGDWHDFAMSELRQGVGHITDALVDLREVHAASVAQEKIACDAVDRIGAERDSLRSRLAAAESKSLAVHEVLGKDLEAMRGRLAAAEREAACAKAWRDAITAEGRRIGVALGIYKDEAYSADSVLEGSESKTWRTILWYCQRYGEVLKERTQLRDEATQLHGRASDNAMHCNAAEVQRDQALARLGEVTAEADDLREKWLTTCSNIAPTIVRMQQAEARLGEAEKMIVKWREWTTGLRNDGHDSACAYIRHADECSCGFWELLTPTDQFLARDSAGGMKS